MSSASARGRMPIEAKPFETAGSQLIEQRASRGLHVERPPVDGGDWEGGGRDHVWHSAAGAIVTRWHEDFARPQNGQLVAEGVASVRAGVFGGREFARGQV